jgi:hypothetical protein
MITEATQRMREVRGWISALQVSTAILMFLVLQWIEDAVFFAIPHYSNGPPIAPCHVT